ncbi:MAG: hypothetical protein EXS00_02265 [Phycisphaerales bacterium]|nr:hypothetical protein [Phycisphaerales bacterium]
MKSVTLGTSTHSRGGNALILVVAMLVIFVIIATAFISRARSLRSLAASQQQSQSLSDQPERIGGDLAAMISDSLFVKPVDYSVFADPTTGLIDQALIPIVTTLDATGTVHDILDTTRLRYAPAEVSDGLWTGFGLQDRFRMDPIDMTDNASGELNNSVVYPATGGLGWIADGFNHAPYQVVPWTNWPDTTASAVIGYPHGQWNPRGMTTTLATLPIGDGNPAGGPGSGDTRWLRSTEPVRLVSADPTDEAREERFAWWLHMSNISRPDNGFRVCWDISNIDYASGTNILLDLSVPVEQWLATVEPGTGNPGNGSQADADAWRILWNNWCSDLASNANRHQAAYRDSARTPGNFYDLADLDGDGIRCEIGEEPNDEFTYNSPRWNVMRTLADADGDGFTDSFWFTVPSNMEKGLRQVVAVTIVDNGSMLDVNTATRFDRRSTRGHTPADLAFGPSNTNRTVTGSDPVPVAMLNARGNLDFTVNGPPQYFPAIDASFNNGRWAGPITLNPLDPAQNETSFLRERRFIRANGSAEPLFDDLLHDPFERLMSFRQSRRSDELVPTDVTGDSFDDVPILSLFGAADEVELRANAARNDPTVMSRLERALGVDTTRDPLGTAGQDAPNVLRSTWSREETFDYGPDRLTNRQLVRDMRHRLTVFSGTTNDLQPPWDWISPYYSSAWNYMDFQLSPGYPLSSGVEAATGLWIADAGQAAAVRPRLYGHGSATRYPVMATPQPATPVLVPGSDTGILSSNPADPTSWMNVNPRAYDHTRQKIDLRAESLPAVVFEVFPSVPVGPGNPLQGNIMGFYNTGAVNGEQWRFDLTHALRSSVLEYPDVLDGNGYSASGVADFGAGRSYYSDSALSILDPSIYGNQAIQDELIRLREQSESLAVSWGANASQYRDAPLAYEPNNLLDTSPWKEQGAIVTDITSGVNQFESRSKPIPILEAPLEPHPVRFRDNGTSSSNAVRHLGLERHPFLMECFVAFVYPKTRIAQTFGAQNPLTAEWNADHWRVPEGNNGVPGGIGVVPGGGEYSVDRRSRARVVLAIQIGNPYDTPLPLKDFRINAWGWTFRFPDNAVLGPTTEERPCTAIVYAIPPIVWGRQHHAAGALNEYPGGASGGPNASQLVLTTAQQDFLVTRSVLSPSATGSGADANEVTRFQADRNFVSYDPFFRDFWLDALDIAEVQGNAVNSWGGAGFPIAAPHSNDWDILRTPDALLPAFPVYQDPTTDWDYDGNPDSAAWASAAGIASGDDTLVFPAEMPYIAMALPGVPEVPEPIANGEQPMAQLVRTPAQNSTTGTVFELGWQPPARHPTIAIEWKLPYRSVGVPLSPSQRASDWILVDRIDPPAESVAPPRMFNQPPTTPLGTMTFTEVVEELREDNPKFVPPTQGQSDNWVVGNLPNVPVEPYWYNGIRIGTEDYFMTWAHATRPWSWDPPDSGATATPAADGVIQPQERAPRFILATSVQVTAPGFGSLASGSGQGTGAPGAVFEGSGSSSQTADGDVYNGFIDRNTNAIPALADPVAADDPDRVNPSAVPPDVQPSQWFRAVGWVDPYHRSITGSPWDSPSELAGRRGKPVFFSTQSVLAWTGTEQWRIYPPAFIHAAAPVSGTPQIVNPNALASVSPLFGQVCRISYGDKGGRAEGSPGETNPNVKYEAFRLPVAWRPSVKDADFEQVGEAMDVATWGIAVETNTPVGGSVVENYQRTARTYGEAICDELDFWANMEQRTANAFYSLETPANAAIFAQADIRERLRFLGRLDPGRSTDVGWASTASWNPRVKSAEPTLPPVTRFIERLVCDGGGMITASDADGDGILEWPSVMVMPSGATGSVVTLSSDWDDLVVARRRFGLAIGSGVIDGEGGSVPGLVNINTAPVEVLRTLPNMERLVTDDSDIQDAATLWRTSALPVTLRNFEAADSGIVGQLGDIPGLYPDPDESVHVRVPEAIIAYRDLAFERNYTDGSDTLGAPWYLDRGTFSTTALTFRPGMRAERGFASPAELRLLSRGFEVGTDADYVNQPAGLPVSYGALQSTSIEYAGRDPYRTVGRGYGSPDAPLDARLSTDTTHGTVAWDPGAGATTALRERDRAAGDAEELNMLFSGISNLVTTRSDTFTVSMRIRTFRQNSINFRWDATDPATIVDDSRYVFAVDRSSVRHPNDKPKLLYFERASP